MARETDILLDKQFEAIVTANDKILTLQKKGIAADYAKLLRNLKFTVSNAYESYAKEGRLSYTEMQKFNRIKKLNAELKDVTAEGTKPAFGRIRTGLEEVTQNSYSSSLVAIGEVANSNIGRELTATEIQEILNKPWSGVTLDERIALRRTDIGNRVRQEVTQAIIREDTYEEMQARLKEITVKDYAKTKNLTDDLGHQVQNDAFNESFKDAAEEDIEITKTWVSAGDDRVRDSHAAMDGQTVDADEKFEIPSGPNKGAQADGPGLFGLPEEDYNCRCWIVAGVRKKQ